MLSARVGQYFKWVYQSPEWVGHGLPGLGLEPPLHMVGDQSVSRTVSASGIKCSWHSAVLAHDVGLHERVFVFVCAICVCVKVNSKSLQCSLFYNVCDCHILIRGT